MPGNKEQTGGDPAGPGLAPLRRCRARGGRAPRAPAAATYPRPPVSPCCAEEPGPAPAAPHAARGSDAEHGREGPPRDGETRGEGRAHPGRTDRPRPAAHLLPPTHPRAGRGAGPAPLGCGQVLGTGAALPAPCPPPARRGRSAPTFRPFPRREVGAGRAGAPGTKRGGGGRRSPTSALQKACCGWMGEQLQASAGRALPSSSTASQASRLGSAAGILRRGCRLSDPAHEASAPAGPGRAAAGKFGSGSRGPCAALRALLRPPLRCLLWSCFPPSPLPLGLAF